MALRCTKAFAAYAGGAPRVIKHGQLVLDTDPVVKGRESHFERVEDHLRRVGGVEQATAEPGERRAVTAPVKSSRRRKPQDPGQG